MFTKIQEGQRYIYILLSSTHTVPARLIRLLTREPYSHTSLALDVELREMYSFARKHIYNPFNSGFVDENIETGIFGRDKNVQCSVYAIPVTEEQYRRVKKELQNFIQNREIYSYNYLGLLGAFVGRNVDSERNYFCSQFVSYVLNESGIKLFRKKTGLIRPFDFHIRLKEYQIYKGSLSEYRKYLQQNDMNNLENYAEAI
ncbi:MAG: hypothetical protein K2I10_06900 [Lachnospiraceae bacterium]|nr:hypothetical protein [Lachnospiraceae bacterium]